MPKGPIIAGIDIGSDKICTIIAAISEESGNTNVIGVSSTKSAGIRKSQIVDIEEAISAITNSVEAAERMAGYHINGAYVSISGHHIQSQNSKGVVAVAEPEGEIVPSDVERVIEAARAISMPSAREIIHVIPRDFSVDSQAGIKDPVGMTGVRLEAEAHLITGSATSMRNIEKCVTELGVEVEGLVFTGLASSYSTLSETEKELGVVLVDIGAGTTAVTAFVEGAIAHSSVIPVGARNISNDIAIGMRISLKSAEKVKLFLSQSGSGFTPPSGASAKEIARLRKDHDMLEAADFGINEDIPPTSRKNLIEGIIRPRLHEIFDLVAKELKEAGLASATPAGVVLTGGGAETVEILDAARRRLPVQARVGIPKGLTGLVEELQSPSYAAATGLIHYGMKNIPLHTGSTRDLFPQFSFSGKGVIDKVTGLIKSLLP